MASAVHTGRRRVRVRVRGTVQGVGFRPYVHRLAGQLGLDGYVLNDTLGVLLEVEGAAGAVDDFLGRLEREAPPLAEVEGVESEPLDLTGAPGFTIRESPRGGTPHAPVTPDTATCEDCLAELADPADRRHRYPFINCTNCGPRFTIVRGIPYDRPLTTMAGFEMCRACQAEYDDPGDRRFHAQPNACPVCGPRAALVAADGSEHRGGGQDAVAAAAAALRAGRVVAVKGLGGYHLACLAADAAAASTLRERKHREDKPFALMVADPAAAAELVVLGESELALLTSPARPIVLAQRRPGACVAPGVAPGAPELGVMLPYSPLHHLLIADVGGALVMTSGNVSDEPIAFRDADALERLAEIADLFLVHDRPIETRTDDSVRRVLDLPAGPVPTFLRRSRGYVPAALGLPVAAPRSVLACGAQLKNTFCLARGDRAWVGHHIGDLENYETLRSFTDGIEHFERLFAVAPEVVACDLHPEYLSGKYAREREDVELVEVQHHHAHLAACLAEHGETGPAVGAIFDGTGWGPDGTVWGGEILAGDIGSFTRVGMLSPVRLPGGERAIREPWRMACAWLSVLGEEPPAIPRALAGEVDAARWHKVAELTRSGVASPLTTSMGRLFDAVAALCGVRAVVNYEGQAAIELEAACAPGEAQPYPLPVAGSDELSVLDARETVRAVVADVDAGVTTGEIAARFHATVADAAARACARAAARHGTELVVLSGGVFQNRRLAEATAARLHAEGLRALLPERLPANDGGIAFGQAAVAAWTAAQR